MPDINQAIMMNSKVKVDNTEFKSRAELAKYKVEDEKTRFLKLFIAQIQNQIPTEPMENKEMGQLTAVFSQVEQQVETNKNLEKLVKIQENLRFGTPLSYLGTEITTDSSYGNLKNGEASFSYNLPEECREVLIRVLDSQGRVVTTAQGPVNAGYNEFVWNGRNQEGVKFPEGEYKIDIEGLRSDKKNISQNNNHFNLEGGKASFNYFLSDEFTGPELVIKNDKNHVIYQTNLKSQIGDNSFNWDGKNSLGNIADDGNYLFEIKGKKLDKANILNSDISLTDEQVEFTYNVKEEAKDIILSVKDDNMREVFRTKLDKTIGNNSFVWNGRNSSGEPLPMDRKYNLEVFSLKYPSQNSNRVTANTVFKGLVTSVDSSTDNPTLTVNGKKIALDKIKSVAQAA